LKNIVTKLAALVLAVCLAGPGNAATVKLGTLAPKGSPWHKALEDMAAQ